MAVTGGHSLRSGRGLRRAGLGTDGWTVWTAESARRHAVLANPRTLPDYPLRDSRGASLSLGSGDERLAVVDLIYTRCPTVCQAMGLQFRQLQGELATFDWLDQVELVSVTFDPANDDDTALNNYLGRYGAVEPYWRAARFVTPRSREMLETLRSRGGFPNRDWLRAQRRVLPDRTMAGVENT